MIFPVSVSFDDGYNIRDGHFDLNAILLSGLCVTSNPDKMVYRNGQRISYSGLAVTAVYSDEATQDVTSKCSISPQENSIFDDNTDVQISYREGQDEQSATLQLIHLYVTELNITHQPVKTVYKTGETISYNGLAVTAVYSDGTTRDVTAACSILGIAPARLSTTRGWLLLLHTLTAAPKTSQTLAHFLRPRGRLLILILILALRLHTRSSLNILRLYP